MQLKNVGLGIKNKYTDLYYHNISEDQNKQNTQDKNLTILQSYISTEAGKATWNLRGIS